MKFKKFLSILSMMMFVISFSMSTNTIYANDGVQVVPQLTVTPNNESNCIGIKWTMADTSQNYSYMIYSKKSTDTEFQSIPAKSKVKVLNVYPDAGNNVKTWMETNGYGKGLISVDEVSIDNFNANSGSYLKDGSGNWKYDVIYLGAWDGNNGTNLNDSAVSSVQGFIKAGRGFLCGHDTIGCDWQNTGIGKLRSLFNIKIGFWDGNVIGDYSQVDIPNNSGVGGSNITVKKQGLLTNYPWKIGNIGDKLTVPFSHSTSQFAYGDIWMTYTDGNILYTSSNVQHSGVSADLLQHSNFYLTTWNNTAMIQTGHSNGAATPDEQKVLANTLFYLAQVTDDTSWEDHKGQDVDAPNKPVIKSVKNDVISNKINISCEPAVDNGSTYDYYVEAKGLTDGVKRDSATKEATITSGIKGYSIVVDKKPGTIPTNTITTTSPDYTLDKSYSSDFYVHVAAVDNAGNISEVTHQKIHVRYANGIVINKRADNLGVGETDKLTASVIPGDALVKTVKWTSSDPSIVTVDDSGNITAVKAGTAIITATVQDGRNLHGQCRVCVTD